MPPSNAQAILGNMLFTGLASYIFQKTTKPIYILIQSAYRKANENAYWNRCRRNHH